MSGKETTHGMDALQSVQFVTANGKRLVVLDAEDWESLVEWLETLEDRQIVSEALQTLKDNGGDRERAGLLDWKAVAGDIE